MSTSGPLKSLFLCSLALVGCAGGKPDCQNARTQSLARSVPANLDPKPRMVGGFLNIETAGAPLKRCAAHFEILSIGAPTRMLLWTARHCGSERFKDAKRLSIDVFLDGAYLTDLEVKDDFLTRRKEALAAAQSAGLQEASRKVMADAFDVHLGVQSKREDAGCSNEELANEASEKGLHAVCANWWDLGVYEIALTEPVVGGPVYDKLSRARIAFEGSRDLARTKITLAGGWVARPDLWRQDLLDAWRYQRHKTSAALVRWVEDNCDARKPDASVPLAACDDRDELVNLADRYLVEDGTSIVDLADRLGYVERGKFKTPNGAPNLAERIKREEGDRVVRIEERWREYGRGFLFGAKNLHLNTNVTESRAAGLGVSYVSMPLASLATTGITLKFVTHGFEYVADKEKVAIQFLPGDSGTIFALEGVWPLVALSGVDGAQSSGGASVTALPARRKSATEGGGASASDNRKSKQETASVDGGCQALY